MDGTAPRAAIVYYSLSGHSKQLATKLAEALDAPLIRLSMPGYTTPVLGYLKAGWDSLRQKKTLPPQSFHSLAEYDLLVLCGPVWTSYPAVPLRALLSSGMALPDRVALFLTSGDRKPTVKAWHIAEEDLGHRLHATASLSNAAENSGEETRQIREFLAQLGPLAPSHAAQ